MPLSTDGVGLTQTGRAVTYVPPNVIQVPRGSTVTYGPWQTVPGGVIGVGIYEISNPGGGLQASNSGFIRTVTITPL